MLILNIKRPTSDTSEEADIQNNAKHSSTSQFRRALQGFALFRMFKHLLEIISKFSLYNLVIH